MKKVQLREDAQTSYAAAAKKPDSLNDHVISKHWVLRGMTPDELMALHSGTQFSFTELLEEIKAVMPDIAETVTKEMEMFSLEFASLVLFTIGPATRQVKEGQRDLCWAITIPSEDGMSVSTIYIATYKGGPPSIMQPKVSNNKITLTIKQASLLALYVVAGVVRIQDDPKLILLTPLAGAIFCKDDLIKISKDLEMPLHELINMINESAQSGGFYLKHSTCAAAAVCAVVATKNAEKKVADSIVTKTVKQYHTHKKEMNWKLFDVLAAYATGGVPSGMTRKELDARIKERQDVHIAKVMKEMKDKELSTLAANLAKQGGGPGPSGGTGGSSGGAPKDPKN